MSTLLVSAESGARGAFHCDKQHSRTPLVQLVPTAAECSRAPSDALCEQSSRHCSLSLSAATRNLAVRRLRAHYHVHRCSCIIWHGRSHVISVCCQWPPYHLTARHSVSEKLTVAVSNPLKTNHNLD